MSNLYSTTLFAGGATIGLGLTVTAQQTAGPVVFPILNNRHNLKFAESHDFTGEKDISVLAQNLQVLNPDEEIRILDMKKDAAKKLIFASTTVDNLEVPKGFRKTADGFHTGPDSKTGEINRFYVVDMHTISNLDELEKKFKPIFEKEKIDYHEFKGAATTTGCLVLTSVINTFASKTYADTYDAKTYMDALSNDQLIEFSQVLENTSLDDFDKICAIEVQPERVKKLVK